jgi:hypothetical protein
VGSNPTLSVSRAGDEAHDLVNHALDVQANTAQQVVLDEWRKPRHREFESRTAWSLFNAFTGVMGSRSGCTVAKRTQVLHFDAHTGLAQERDILPALPAPMAA